MGVRFEVVPITRAEAGAWVSMRGRLGPEWVSSRMDELVASYFATGRIDHLEHMVLLARAEGTGEALGFSEVSLREFAEGCETSPVGYLEGWFVMDSARGLGVGRALVEAGEAWARSRGCREFASDAEVENGASIAAHGRLGFEEVCRVVCFRKGL